MGLLRLESLNFESGGDGAKRYRVLVIYGERGNRKGRKEGEGKRE